MSGSAGGDPLGETETATRTGRVMPAASGLDEVPVVEKSHYRVVREVARGGVGRILEAVDTRLQREVALKQLLRPSGEQGRFIREAVLTARLQHPAIVPIHEVGVFDTGEPFIAMKLVRGECLREAIQKRATLAERMELISAVLAVAEAVAYAHSQRVIHRDLKPSNVLLGSFGEVVVIDWGLAKHLDKTEPESAPSTTAPAAVPELTQIGDVVGTPAYMPPEQALGEPVDERADVYALGAMLYHVLTGAAPVAGDSAEEILNKLCGSRIAPVEQLLPDLHVDLAAIVGRAMMPVPGDRYANAAELAADLRRFQLGQIVSVTRPTADRDALIDAAFQQELSERTTSTLRVLGIIAFLTIAAAAFIPWLHHGRFVAADLGPRGVTVFAIGVLTALAYVPAAARFTQQLGMVLILLVDVFFVVVNVLEGNAIGWFTASTISAMLAASVLLPLTPSQSLLLFGAMLLFSVIEAVWVGLPPTGVEFNVQVTLVFFSAVVAVIGSRINYHVRRAEFYNRFRLQAANERLARFDRGMR